MAELTKISTKGTEIWGFHQPCNFDDVKNAVITIAGKLIGKGNTIHIMSGTHGCCGTETGTHVGAVTPKMREPNFLQEDKALVGQKFNTSDNNMVVIQAHDFNTSSLGPDPVTAAMSQLNAELSKIVTSTKGNSVFLLAYCCSAGTK